jgi:hypothetical protein
MSGHSVHLIKPVGPTPILAPGKCPKDTRPTNFVLHLVPITFKKVFVTS